MELVHSSKGEVAMGQDSKGEVAMGQGTSTCHAGVVNVRVEFMECMTALCQRVHWVRG